MSDTLNKAWKIALFCAASQLAVAIFAVYSSNQYVRSDGACVGGLLSLLGGLLFFVGAAIAMLVLTVKTRNAPQWHSWLAPLFIVLASSALSFFLGQYAALRCTA